MKITMNHKEYNNMEAQHNNHELAQAPFANQVKALVNQMQESTPQLDDITRAQEIAGQLKPEATGYRGPDGRFINRTVAEELNALADIESWKLDTQSTENLRDIVASVDAGTLPDGMKRDFNKGIKEQLSEVKAEAEARLNLDLEIRRAESSDEITRLKDSHQSHYAKGLQLARKRQLIIDQKVANDLRTTEKKSFEEALAREQPALDSEIENLDGDTLERHYKAEQLKLEAKKRAEQTADNSYRSRRERIEATGGSLQGLSVVEREDAEADVAQAKQEWKKRMGVGESHSTKTRNPTKSATEATGVDYKTDPTAGDMSYADWLNAGGSKAAEVRVKKASSEHEAWTVFQSSDSEGDHTLSAIPRREFSSEDIEPMVASTTTTTEPRVSTTTTVWHENSSSRIPTAEERLLTSHRLEEANKAQEAARIEFARLNANRRGKTYTRNGGGFSKEDLDAALNKWVTAREKAGELAASLLKIDGHSDEAIKELFSPAGYLYEATELARLTMEFEAVAAGRKIANVTEDGQVIYEESPAEQTKRGKLQRKFYDFWARSGRIKKTLITAGAGMVLGVAAAPVVAVGGSAALAAGLGVKISKNLAVARINKKANGRTVSLRSEQAFFNKVNQISRQGESNDEVPSSEALGAQLSAVTNETVRGNRRRAALMAGGIIGGAVVGSLIHGQFGGGGSDEHGSSSSSTAVNEQQSGGSGGSAVETAANHRVGGRVGSTLNEQTSGINTSEVPTASPAIPVSEFNHIDTSGYRVPYSWAEQEFGRVNAMNQLRELAEKAQQDGHSVEWHGSGGNEWIEIDGASDTDSVVNILNTYR